MHLHHFILAAVAVVLVRTTMVVAAPSTLGKTIGLGVLAGVGSGIGVAVVNGAVAKSKDGDKSDAEKLLTANSTDPSTTTVTATASATPTEATPSVTTIIEQAPSAAANDVPGTHKIQIVPDSQTGNGGGPVQIDETSAANALYIAAKQDAPVPLNVPAAASTPVVSTPAASTPVVSAPAVSTPAVSRTFNRATGTAKTFAVANDEETPSVQTFTKSIGTDTRVTVFMETYIDAPLSPSPAVLTSRFPGSDDPIVVVGDDMLGHRVTTFTEKRRNGLGATMASVPVEQV